MSSTLYEKHNYLNKNIRYLKNTSIIEYDIHAAGTCILYELGLIKKELFEYLMSLDKFTRNRLVGDLLAQHPKWNKLQMKGFSDVMKRFMEENNIEDRDILSIKKDSIVLIGSKVIRSLFIDNLYQFNITGKYNNYMYLKEKELYINSKTLNYDTKNFNKDVLEVQSDYFINFILSTIVLNSERDNRDEVFSSLKYFRSKFLNKELEDEYYFDLDEGSYIFNYNGTILSTSYKDINKNYSIDNNYLYLEELIQLLFVDM